MDDCSNCLREIRALARESFRKGPYEPQAPVIEAMLHTLRLMIEEHDEAGALDTLDLMIPSLLRHVVQNDLRAEEAHLTILAELQRMKHLMLVEIAAYSGGFTEASDAPIFVQSRRKLLVEIDEFLEELTRLQLASLSSCDQSCPVAALEALTGRSFPRIAAKMRQKVNA
jgi:hypothetical protein